MYASAARARFVDHSLETASPSRLLTLLYDRLVLDLARAEAALTTGDRAGANTQLLHAQDVVTALSDALDRSWGPAEGLAALYDFLLTELVTANVERDAARVGACRALVEPLRDAWHEAALGAASAVGGPLQTA